MSDLVTARVARPLSTTIVLAAAASLALPLVARAQATITTDLGLNSAFVWRGVTSTNRFVLEPDVLIAIPLPRATRTTLTLGGWTNIEPAKYDGPHDLSPLAGNPGPAATSSQVWAEARRAMGDGGVTVGFTRYLYPNVGDLRELYNTNEVYAIASAPRLFGLGVAPTVSAYYDVQKVQGAYVEGSLSRDVGVSVGHHRRQAVTFSTTVGYSAGQGTDVTGAQSAYFATDGVTHVDVGARTALVLGALTVAPTAHVVFGRDELARLTAPDRLRSAKVWIGTTLSWGHALGHAASESSSAESASTESASTP
ncbi:MAG: hypothetical protein JO180_04785 [Gemmatirosa sp.]|nr:hypothetical protein [Gemmatirosa sp.]